MEISIIPDQPLVDEKLNITISGLKPRQEITVKTSVSERKASLSASACYISDVKGNVHIRQQSSLAGTYTGIDGMGLFWSMIPDPGQPQGQRYLRRIVTTPQIVRFSVFIGHYSWNDCHSNSLTPIFSKEFQRFFLHKTVTRKEIREGNLRGTMFIPPGAGPFPGVIDMFGGAGGLIEFRASLLASKGFITYALPFFDFEDLSETLEGIDFDYIKNSVDWFSSHPMVIKDGIGVCGTSKGGEIGLMVTTKCPKIKAVVNINGTPFCSYCPMPPFTNYVRANFDVSEFREEGVSIRDIYCADLTEDKVIKTWHSDATILYIVSEDDQSINPKFAEILYNSYPEDQRHKLIIKRYHNAGHLIEPPYNPVCFASHQKNYGTFLWGGKPKDHQKAQEDSWRTIIQFLKSFLLPTRDSLNCRTSNL